MKRPGAKTASYWRTKEEVEAEYGTWYTEPRYDLESDEFDLAAARALAVEIVAKAGLTQPEIGLAWRDLTVQVDVASGPPVDTVGTQALGVWKGVYQTLVGLVRWRRAARLPAEDRYHTILSKVSGYARPGEMVLVLAPPGGGASTLLKLLASRREGFATTSGAVLYNGEEAPDEHLVALKHVIRVIGQDDVHFPQLTVRDTLKYAAEFKVPDFYPYAPVLRRNRVMMVARTLGISNTLDTPVGDSILRGVSGGEKKRVTVGEMAVAGVAGSLMLMDNWSRGLDSATTLDITKAIRDIAQRSRAVVVSSMQQPPEEVFDQFDKLCVLDAGRCLYFGPTQEAAAYFTSLGFTRPPTRSVPELITTVSDPSFQEALITPGCESTAPRTVGDFVDAFARSSHAKDVQEALDEGVKGDRDANLTPDLERKVHRTALQSPFRQFKILFSRSVRLIVAQPLTFVVTVLANVLFGLALGSIFFNVDSTQAGAFSRGGLLFLGQLFLAFGEIATLPTKWEARAVFGKQSTGAGFYNVLPFILSAYLVDALTVLLKSVTYACAIFFLAGLNPGNFGERFAYFILVLFSLSLFVSTYARLLSTFSNKDIANAIAGVGLIVMVIFSGFLVAKDSIPNFLIWLYWISPVQYAYSALLINEYSGLEFTCSPAGLLPYNTAVPDALKVCPVSTGVAYLESSFQTRTDGMWRLWNVLILFGFNLLCLVVTVIQMSALKPQGYRYRAPENAVDPDVRSCPRVAYDYHVSRTSTTSLPEGAMAVRIASARDAGIKNGARADEASSRSSTGASSSGDKPAGDGTKAALMGGHGAVLTFSELCYTVESNGEPKQLLDNVVGYAEHGKMLALMGSSGAGKTTLLDVLAQRKTGGETTGSVLLNGVRAEPLSFARLSGYVEQSDLHVQEATVREALEFSAALRGGREVSDAEKAERVEGAMDKLQLRSVQDLLVKQLSPSHLKKLTIGIELVGIGTDAILFLDEPTSGLDGRDALSVITSLQLIAADRVAIVCTVHQPSKELFASFDRLLLLSRGGKMVYMGDLNAAEGEPHADEVCGKLMAYFEDHGAEPLPPRRNPADHMLTVIGAGTSGSSSIDWNQTWLDSEERKAVEARIAGTDGKPLLVPPELHGQVPEANRRAASRRMQLRYNIMRMYRRYWRLPAYNFTRLVTMLFFACLLGLALLQIVNFSNDGNTQEAASLIPGAAFLSILPGMLSTNNAVSPSIATRAAFYRELAAGEYGVWAFYVAQGAAEVPYAVLQAIFFLVPYNALIGFPWSAFPFYLLASIVFYTFASMVGQAIAAISPTEEIALTIAPLLNTLLNVLSGFLIKRDDIPSYWIWLFYANPYAYFNASVLRNLLPDMTFTCTAEERAVFPLPPDFASCSAIPDSATYVDVTLPSGEAGCSFCPIPTGDTVLDLFTVLDVNKWVCIAALCGFVLVARIATALALKFTKHMTR